MWSSKVCVNILLYFRLSRTWYWIILVLSGLSSLNITLHMLFQDDEIHSDSRMKMLNVTKMSIYIAVQFLKLMQEKVEHIYSLVINKVKNFISFCFFFHSTHNTSIILLVTYREDKKTPSFWSWKKNITGIGKKTKNWYCPSFVKLSNIPFIDCGIHQSRKKNSSGYWTV